MTTANETVVVNHSGFRLPPAVTQLPGIKLVDAAREGDLDASIRGDVVLTLNHDGTNLSQLLSRETKWVHTFGTGVDRFPVDAIDGQLLTCGRGASAEPIGEWVLAQMLAHAKSLPHAWISEPPEKWARNPDIGTLRGATVVIVGLGGIGSEVARLAAAFSMELVGVRRTGTRAPVPNMAVANDLSEVIGEADHLVLAAPATAETRHLLDERMLSQVRPGVHVVNIARGSLIDQNALRTALDDGRVALASLDVCDPEPLPSEHWLYHHPRVHFSPHISWADRDAFATMVQQFVDNYHRWQAGEPLVGLVDIQAGY